MSHVHVEVARSSSNAMDGHKAKIDHKADFYMEDGFCVFTENSSLKKNLAVEVDVGIALTIHLTSKIR